MVENLTDALKYRCGREIAQVSNKMSLNGSIEHVSCITKHDDFSSMMNSSVMSGSIAERQECKRGYHCHDGQKENHCVSNGQLRLCFVVVFTYFH